VILGDGSQTRDFIYVGDIVGAIVAALFTEGRLAQESGASYNISTGERTSVESLVMSLRLAANYLGSVEHEPPREGDIVHSVLDPSRAAAAFGWKANVDLETGIAWTWRWFAAQ